MARKHAIAAAVITIAAAFGGGCGGRGVEAPSTAKVGDVDTIEKAFLALLDAEDEQAFLIFEDAATGAHFVQFAGAKTVDLMLDLPIAHFSEDEKVRAEAFFATYGVTAPEVVTGHYLDDSGHRSSAVTMEVYQLDLGRDAGKAAEIVHGIFKEVYRFPEDADLKITLDVGVSSDDLKNVGLGLPGN